MRGHIRRRGANSWEIKYDAGRAGGERKTIYRSFKGTRREAQAELARLLASVADGGHVEPSKLTVGAFVRSRLEQWRASGAVTPATAQRYEQLIEGQIVPHLGGRLLQKLNTRDIEAWHVTLMARGRRGRNGRPDGEGGISARTIGHAHKVLSKALSEGMRHGFLLRNVCTLERPPKVAAEEMEILTPQQVEELPALLHGHALEAPALLALNTGLRRGEILALSWGDIDLEAEAEVIHVRRSLEETKAGLRFKAPKSKAGTRDVTLPAIAVDVLQAHYKRELERRLQLGQGRPGAEDLVFPAWDGSPQSPNMFGVAWGRLAKELDLGVTFHALRHTHASWLIHLGLDVVTISKRLGHSSPAVTLQIYAHLFERDDRKAAAAINAALGRAGVTP
jgi:integrase